MVWYVGSTPYNAFKVYDRDGALTTPAAITVTTYDPNGKAVDSDKAPTEISTGYYYYAGWTVSSTSIKGTYTLLPKTTDSGIVIINHPIEFEVGII